MSRIHTRHPEREGQTPRRPPLWPLMALLTLGSAAAPAQAYTTIDCPDSSSSSARSINDRGDIVGSCDDSNGSHGFLLRQGTFTMIDFPGATLTTAFGINNRGDVVGRYTDADDVVHGYLLRHGHFSTIDPPGMIAGSNGPPRTAAVGIDDLGRIVGFYDGSDGVHHGYVFDSGVFELRPLPVRGRGPLLVARQRAQGLVCRPRDRSRASFDAVRRRVGRLSLHRRRHALDELPSAGQRHRVLPGGGSRVARAGLGGFQRWPVPKRRRRAELDEPAGRCAGGLQPPLRRQEAGHHLRGVLLRRRGRGLLPRPRGRLHLREPEQRRELDQERARLR